MMYQACHLHPIVGGNVSRAVYQTLNDHLLWRDLDEQRRQLIENHVKYIVIHRPDGKVILSKSGKTCSLRRCIQKRILSCIRATMLSFLSLY